jgi:hypothetical protein
MKVGDIVRIKTGSGYFEEGESTTCYWSESKGQIGVIIKMAKRLYIPAAKVMLLGEVAEFDIDELEKV